MNSDWSQYVQTSEELYRSRALRFHEGNRDLWLNALGLRDGMKVLELGCGGGLFCHRIKSFLPATEVTGLDRDAGHIAYARAKAAELGLNCAFVCGDATELPYASDSFDLCFSHTVFEHVPTEPFLREQRRVLKDGGRIVVLSVRMPMGLRATDRLVTGGEEEQALLAKAWRAAEANQPVRDIGAYELPEADYPRTLERFGFKDVTVDFLTVTGYCPDSAGTPEATALEQIDYNRYGAIVSAEKALRMAPEGLTGEERQRLFRLIEERHTERVARYRRGEKLWDMSASTVLAVSGVK